MLSAARTLNDLVEEVAYELGDAENAIWSRASLQRHARRGYAQLVTDAELIWGVDYLPDLPRIANYTAAFERDMFAPGQPVANRFNTTYGGEEEFASALTAPAQCTAFFELEFLDMIDGAGTPPLPAVCELPSDAYRVARVTHDARRISPATRSELQATDFRYRTTRGPVVAFALDGDGISSLRKYRTPSTLAAYYRVSVGSFGTLRASGGAAATLEIPSGTVTGGMRIDEFDSAADGAITSADRARLALFGFAPRVTTVTVTTVEYTEGPAALTVLDLFSGMEIIGSFGVLRRAPGLHPIHLAGRGGFGIPRRIHLSSNNTRIEYWGRGETPDDLDVHRIEIPRAYARYIKHYMKWHAFDSDGDGHSAKLADLYRGRYAAGVARAASRRSISRRVMIAGSGSARGGGLSRPRLPWQYGQRRGR